MNRRLRIRWQSLVCLVLVFPFIGAAPSGFLAATAQETLSAGGPQVSKVEPPNWWVSFPPKPMLLLTGKNLDQATVTTKSAGVSILRVQPGADDHYLFVWLDIQPRKSASVVELQVKNQLGGTTVRFPLLTRSSHVPAGVSRDDVIYLIMPDRFADGDVSNDQAQGTHGIYDRSQPRAYHGGDLRGIRDHLPYLHDLGVTTLWLTPIWKNGNSDYHGYGVVDFYAVDEHMGSLSEYRELVAAAHQLGMKVVIDYVVNHTGATHPWANDPPLADWFHGTPQHHLPPNYTFFSLTDPHATAQESMNVLDGWFANVLPDLNQDEPLVADYLLENALWWTESAQLDGFRLDTFPYAPRRFWNSWHTQLFQAYPSITSIGEVSDHDAVVTSFFQGGRAQLDGVDSRVTTIFDYPLFYVLRDVIVRGAPMQKLIDHFREDSLYPRPEVLSTFLGNHDVRRFMGEPGASAGKLEAAFALVLTMRGIPELYYGDEIGMPGGEDPDNRRDFPGGFPGDARNAFTAGGRTPEEEQIFEFVRSLLHVKQAHPALRTGHQWNIGWDDTYYAYVREMETEKLLVIFNNSSTARDLTISLSETTLERAATLEVLFGKGQAQISNKTLKATLPPESVAVFNVQ